MNRYDRALAILKQAERVLAMAKTETDEQRKVELMGVAECLEAEARNMARPLLSSRCGRLCLQWSAALSNAFVFWTNCADGNYVLAAISLCVLMVLASWNIPPDEKTK